MVFERFPSFAPRAIPSQKVWFRLEEIFLAKTVLAWALTFQPTVNQQGDAETDPAKRQTLGGHGTTWTEVKSCVRHESNTAAGRFTPFDALGMLWFSSNTTTREAGHGNNGGGGGVPAGSTRGASQPATLWCHLRIFVDYENLRTRRGHRRSLSTVALAGGSLPDLVAGRLTPSPFLRVTGDGGGEIDCFSFFCLAVASATPIPPP